jgi:hypothetical protein
MIPARMLIIGIPSAIGIGSFLFLSPDQMQGTFIMLGHGHFVSAFIYRFKASRDPFRFSTDWLLTAAAIFSGYFLFRNFAVLVTVTAIYTMLHFLLDERFLLENNLSEFSQWASGLLILALTILYAGMIVSDIFPAVNMGLFLLGAILFVGLYCVVKIWRWQPFSLVDNAMLAGCLLMLWLYCRHIHVQATYLIGTVTLFHYAHWYIHYYFRVRSSRERKKEYLLTVGFLNSVIISGFLMALYCRQNSFIAGALYRAIWFPESFYLWTLVHLATTTRLSDLNSWVYPFKRRQPAMQTSTDHS